MTTRASFSQHWWPRIFVFAAIAGPASQPWVAEASNKFLAENSGLVFPGKATWGTSKDVSGPISFSVGTPKRSGRSVLVGARPRQDEKEGIRGAVFRGEGQRWEGRTLPLVNEEEGMVVSASISIAGGESKMEDQGDQQYNGPSLLPPSSQPRPQSVTPFHFNWWWRRRSPFARQQLNKGREEMDGKFEILRAGLMGDSPFVYTRRLSRSSTNEAPRLGRVYKIREEAPQAMEVQNTKSQGQYGSSNDDKHPERTTGVTIQQDHVLIEQDLPQVPSRQEENNVTEEIEEGLSTSLAQKIVSVEKRHAENNDIFSNDAPLVTAVASQEAQRLKEVPDVAAQSETATPEDQGVKTAIYVNPSKEGKFLVYFEEERTNSSSLSSTSSSHETQQMNPVDQSSSKYSSAPSSPSRPRYIIVKEDPLDHLTGGSNGVASHVEGPRYRVQASPGVSTERNPTSESPVATELNPDEKLSRTNMTGSEIGKAHAKPHLKRLGTKRGSRLNLNDTTFYPTTITDSFASPTTDFDSQETVPETPESGINEIEGIALSEQNEGDAEETTPMSVEPRTPVPSQALQTNGKNQEAFKPDEIKDLYVGQPRALRLKEESQPSGSVRTGPHALLLLPVMLLVSVCGGVDLLSRL